MRRCVSWINFPYNKGQSKTVVFFIVFCFIYFILFSVLTAGKKTVFFSIFPRFFFRFFPSSKTGKIGKIQKNERNSIKIAAILNDHFRHEF